MDRPPKEPDVSTIPDLPNTVRCPLVHQFPFPRKTPVDISPELDRLRTHEPVCRVRMATGDEAWLVTRYDDVRFVLDDPRFSMKEASSGNAAELMPMVKLFPGLFSLDGAEHARSRQLLARGFKIRDTQSFRSWLTKTADELALDLLADNLPADLIIGFCEPLVTRVAFPAARPHVRAAHRVPHAFPGDHQRRRADLGAIRGTLGCPAQPRLGNL